MTASKPIATRQAFGEALEKLGAQFPHVVVLEADLAKSTRSELFGKKFPERYFDLGIAEQNMIGVASGLALSGKTAFCCSFACFVAGRFETIRMSVAYAGANVSIVGTHAGVGIGPDGYSQMGLEDIAMMRSLSQMSVFQPADDVETAQIVQWLCSGQAGPSYLRLTRQNLNRVHDEQYRFVVGALDVLAEGRDVAVFATGGTVMHAMGARELLKDKGIDAAVVNVPSIKPLDADAVRAWAVRVPHIVTVEDHSVLGGLGGAIAEIVAQSGGARVTRHGIHDVFGESGSPEDLYAHFKLDAAGITGVVASTVMQKTSR
jgi:transketolase